MASRGLAAPVQDARMVAHEGMGTGLGGGIGVATALGDGEGLGVGVGVALASSVGVGLAPTAVPPPPQLGSQLASTNSKAAVTPSLTGDWNDDRKALVTPSNAKSTATQ
jgi:hypothetical protein